MKKDKKNSFHRIKLTNERKETLIRAIQAFYFTDFDEEISVFRAEELLIFFQKTLAPPIYNQAVQDARAYMMQKLDDIEGEIYENTS